MDSTPIASAVPAPGPLEVKYLIQHPLTTLPETWPDVENWIVKELRTRTGRWGDETIVQPSFPFIVSQCPIPRADISKASLDPIRRVVGYLFERCGRDDFETAFASRLSTHDIYPWSINNFGVQPVVFEVPPESGTKLQIGKAVYAWPEENMGGGGRNPQAVAKTDFVTGFEEDLNGLARLSSELLETVIAPYVVAQNNRPLQVEQSQRKDTPGGVVRPSGGAESGKAPQMRLDERLV